MPSWAQQDAAIERAERDLVNTELRAPFAGLVAEVTAAAGKRLGVGDPIARLIDEGRIEIRFTLSDAEFGRLWRDGLIGRDLQARWRLGTTTFPLEGRVARIESTIDPSSGGVEVYAEITANPDGAPLRPGAFVEILLPDRLHQQVVELPRAPSTAAIPCTRSPTAVCSRGSSSWSRTSAVAFWSAAASKAGSRADARRPGDDRGLVQKDAHDVRCGV